MNVWIRNFLIVVVAVVLLVLVAGVAATLLIDPNDYRAQIAQAVEDETGRRLTLDGEIDLTAFPCCSLELGPAALSNPPGWSSDEFAAIDRASISVRVLPLLLSQKLQIGNVELAGLSLNLHVRGDGAVNWSFAAAAPSDTPDTATDGPDAGNLAVAGIAIRDAQVNYRDDASGDDIKLRGINLTTGTIRAGEPVSIDMSIAAEGLVDSRTLSFEMSADALFDAAVEQFALENIRAQFDDSTLTGFVRLTDIANQALQFDLQVDRFNADAYMETDAGAASESTEDDEEAQATRIPSGAVRALQLDGSLAVDALTFSGAQLSDVIVTVSADDGLVRLNPLKASLYGGSYAGNVRLDVRGNVPRLVVNEKLQGIELTGLLQDMAEISDLAGTGNVTFKGEARARTVEGLINNLTGEASFALQDGLYRGIDLWHEIRSARALLKKTERPAAPSNPQTELSEFSGTLNFTDGAVVNPDFTAKVPFLRLTGSGRYSLIDNGLDYSLQARVVETPTFSDETGAGEELDSLTGLTLPIRLRGTLDDPSVRIDLGDLVKDAARDAAKDKLKDRLRDKLGADDEAATTDEASLTEPQDPEDEAKEQLKRKLRGLLD